jgi:hypothetical protein
LGLVPALPYALFPVARCPVLPSHLPSPALPAVASLRARTGFAEKCARADIRRREIQDRVDELSRDPRSRNPTGKLAIEIGELQNEAAALPTIWDIDPAFTLAPQSGMIRCVKRHPGEGGWGVRHRGKGVGCPS